MIHRRADANEMFVVTEAAQCLKHLKISFLSKIKARICLQCGEAGYDGLLAIHGQDPGHNHYTCRDCSNCTLLNLPGEPLSTVPPLLLAFYSRTLHVHDLWSDPSGRTESPTNPVC